MVYIFFIVWIFSTIDWGEKRELFLNFNSFEAFLLLFWKINTKKIELKILTFEKLKNSSFQ